MCCRSFAYRRSKAAFLNTSHCCGAICDLLVLRENSEEEKELNSSRNDFFRADNDLIDNIGIRKNRKRENDRNERNIEGEVKREGGRADYTMELS